MKLYFNAKESFQLVCEVYTDKAAELLIEPMLVIEKVQHLKQISAQEATTICIEKTNSVENQIRFQAAYFIMKNTKNDLKKINNEIEKIKNSIIALGFGNYSNQDRADLHKYYTDRITILSERKQKIICNLEVEGAVEIRP